MYIYLDCSYERAERLHVKLREYWRRPKIDDTYYKIAVLQRLLWWGWVDIDQLGLELLLHDHRLNLRAFRRACFVISDYVATGGDLTEGGTGLPAL